MSIQSKTEHSLNDLIAISRDGKDFYEEAAAKVGDVELATLFRRIAGVKSDIVSNLSSVVASVGGKPETSGTMVGSMQQFYGKVRATLGDTKYGYVAELEESEDRLLKAFDETIADQDTPAAARDAALRLLPEVRACHDVMRNRKHAMKSAA
ncbi:PA2169 family four-helix-bundle protein [Xanthomonas campestris pv. asclepiadis]|uniref:PA2169 family four-helix-bundle protein n=1 Tax=Xanthomonas campestris TaxID=339 RepID=UPI001E2BB080|nr:PA2169 family four-helix-bundle protein [Xanthomonas campestris]MCC4616812.1 PA2169 family four-helix-bundle protein [Xanthomonas campestris pv. asclepiadis]